MSAILVHLPAAVSAIRFALSGSVVTMVAVVLADRERFAALIAVAALWSVGERPVVVTREQLDHFIDEAT